MFNRTELLIHQAGRTDICATCKNYHEYYVKVQNAFGLQTVDAGEGVCTKNRFKRMRGYKSCEDWKERP